MLQRNDTSNNSVMEIKQCPTAASAHDISHLVELQASGMDHRSRGLYSLFRRIYTAFGGLCHPEEIGTFATVLPEPCAIRSAL